MGKYLVKFTCILVILLNSFKITNCNISGTTNSYKKLKGKELRVVIGQFPPQISFTRDASGNITGFNGHLYQMLLWLSQKLEFSFNIFPAKENTNGIKRNGTWNGIIGTLLREEADLALVPVAISLERYEAVNFCGILRGDWTGIIVRYPPATVSFSGAIDIFSAYVWIGFLFSGILVIGFFSLIQYLRSLFLENAQRNRTNLGDTALYVWSTIVSQGTRLPSNQGPKVLVMTWCLTAFVFVNIYNSTLASYMSVTYQRPEINSFNDLATSSTYKAAVAIGSIQEIDLMSAKTGDFKAIGDKVHKCADCRDFTNEALTIKVLENENFVALMPTSVGRGFMQKFSSERGKCRLTMAKEVAVFQNIFLAVPKTSQYMEEVQLGTLWYHASGIYNYWFVLREKYPKQCMLRYNSNGQSTSRSSRRLKLKQFYLPFLILFGGYVLAFIHFIREKIYC